MERDQAIQRAAQFAPAELIAQIRATASSMKRTPLSSPLDPLADVIVHGQDIARPLGRPLPTSSERTLAALNHVVASRWYGAPKRFASLNLSATDADWSHGQGTDNVSGPAIDLLLVATGRTQALNDLTGNGLARLADRMRR
jgi:uncharacterized protein (TIGR03083 family)